MVRLGEFLERSVWVLEREDEHGKFGKVFFIFPRWNFKNIKISIILGK